MIVDLEWWVYLFLVIVFFASCVILNYIVKKVNEAKLEDRFIRMRQKVSTTQSTQVHGPSIEIETSRGSKSQNNTDKSHNSPPGISLVFNQAENMLTDKRRKDLEDTFTIKNTVDLRKHEGFTLNTKSPQESDETSLAKRDEKNDTGHKTGSLGISLKDSKVITTIKTVKEDVNEGGFMKTAEDSTVGKIGDAINANDEPKSEKTLTEWIKDFLVPQLPKEVVPTSSETSTKK